MQVLISDHNSKPENVIFNSFLELACPLIDVEGALSDLKYIKRGRKSSRRQAADEMKSSKVVARLNVRFRYTSSCKKMGRMRSTRRRCGHVSKERVPIILGDAVTEPNVKNEDIPTRFCSKSGRPSFL